MISEQRAADLRSAEQVINLNPITPILTPLKMLIRNYFFYMCFSLFRRYSHRYFFASSLMMIEWVVFCGYRFCIFVILFFVIFFFFGFFSFIFFSFCKNDRFYFFLPYIYRAANCFFISFMQSYELNVNLTGSGEFSLGRSHRF